MKKLLFTLTLVGLCVSCGGTTTTPSAPPVDINTPPPAPPPVPPPAPIARFSVTTDGIFGAYAIRGISTVRFDGIGSSGSGLRYAIDYGDGGGVDAGQGTHVYSGAGVYKARLIVTDSIGQKDTSSVDVHVENLARTWTSSYTNPVANRYEYRTLSFDDVSPQFTGFYRHPEGWSSPMSGQLVGRGVALHLTDGTVDFTSPDSGGFNENLGTLRLKVRGGSADGQTLTFTAYGGD